MYFVHLVLKHMNASTQVRFEPSIANGRRHSFRYTNLFTYIETAPIPGARTVVNNLNGGNYIYGPFEVNSKGHRNAYASVLFHELL